MRRIRKNSTINDLYSISPCLYQCYSNNLFGVVSIAQLVEVTDSAVLGGVVEDVNLNLAMGYKYFFSI